MLDKAEIKKEPPQFLPLHTLYDLSAYMQSNFFFKYVSFYGTLTIRACTFHLSKSNDSWNFYPLSGQC